MADHHSRRSRQTKKPLSEIEAATEEIRQCGLMSIQEHVRKIMTIGDLSKGERDELVISANKAINDTIMSVGFQLLQLREKYKRKTASTGRTGNSEKATSWHAKAKELRDALWIGRPDFIGNARATAETIHADLKAFCLNLKKDSQSPALKGQKRVKTVHKLAPPPQPGTVAKYLSSLEKAKGCA
jgi:hypothetical protein